MISRVIDKYSGFITLRSPRHNYIKNIIILAVIYVISAKLGLFFAISNSNVTMIWPPSGIALAALIIYGMRLWPGVLIGAFIANMMASDNLIASLGVGVGNTLSAVLGAWLISRLIGNSNPLSSVSNLYKFFIVACTSTMVASSVGPTMLVLNDLAEKDSWGMLSWIWWVGDTASILVFAPLILSWQRNIQPPLTYKPNYLEVTLFTILLIIVTSLPFFSSLNADVIGYPIAFICFPFCVWAAYRYCMKQITFTIVIIMVLAIYATAIGLGPFYRESLNDSLFQLQVFMIITVVTTLSLAAAVFERQRFETQLIAENKRAEELTHAKSQFMSSMSHELRTPLNAIIGFSHVLQQDKEQLNEQHQEFIGYISEAGDHLLHLVNDLLDIEQSDSHKLSIDSVRVNLHHSIIESIRFIEHLAHKNDVTVNYHAAGNSDLSVLADPVRLRQILINLLSNAAKYNREGGSISIHCDQKTSSSVSIVITDTGIGIADEDLSTIFEPFNRLKIEESEIEGSGIGLTVTHTLIKLMNGTIVVTSKLGEGSTFTITLPTQ